MTDRGTPGRVSLEYCWQATGAALVGGMAIGYPRAMTRGVSTRAAMWRGLRTGTMFGMFVSMLCTTAFLVQEKRGRVDLLNSVAGGLVAGAGFGLHPQGPGFVKGTVAGAGLGLLVGAALVQQDRLLAQVRSAASVVDGETEESVGEEVGQDGDERVAEKR